MAFDIFGNNYLSWVLDTKIHLDAINLGDSIKENNDALTQDCAKAMIFLRNHLHEQLKMSILRSKNHMSFGNVLMKASITKKLLFFQKFVMIGYTYYYKILNFFVNTIVHYSKLSLN